MFSIPEPTDFFYVSVGGNSIAVATAPSPRGPWTDPLGKPLLDDVIGKSLTPPTTFRDPAIFRDDDGKRYLIAGVFVYYIAELSDDMLSFRGPLRHVVVHHPFGACGQGQTDDKPFIHKHGGLYYLSWGCFYATSSTLFGPYEMGGSVIDTARIAQDFRIGAPKSPWFMAEDYTDRHGSFLHAHGQWYFAANDRSHSGDTGHEGAFRDTIMGYIHYRSNGTMEPMIVNRTGVGSYDARAWIEAENFFALDGGAKVDLLHHGGGDGFAVALYARRAGSVLMYPRVAHLPHSHNVTLVMRCSSALGLAPISSGELSRSLSLEVLVSPALGTPLDDSAVKRLAGRCAPPWSETRSWVRYIDVLCPIRWPASVRESSRMDVSLSLVWTPANDGVVTEGTEVLRVDRFAIVGV